MSIAPRNTRSVTLKVEEHEFDAFMRHLDTFREKDAQGRPAWQAAAEARAEQHDAALDALSALLTIAEEGEGAEAETVAAILASLYNGYDFPLNLGELRILDEATLNAVMLVVRAHANGLAEVHTHFPNGQTRWQAFMRRFGLLPQLPRAPFESETPRYQLELQSVSDRPGYREATIVADVLGTNVPSEPPARVELAFRASDTERLAKELVGIHQRAWRGGTPLDAKPDDVRPIWL